MRAALAMAIVTLLLLTSCGEERIYDDFASCLTESGAKMFGAYWCQHCLNQKKAFGGSFEYINYIECSLPGGRGQTEVCQRAGIQGYPTWEFADGERISGEVSLQALAEKTGCSLPVQD